MRRKSRFHRDWNMATLLAGMVIVGLLALSVPLKRVSSQSANAAGEVKGQKISDLLSSGGIAARAATRRSSGGIRPFAALVPDPGDGLIPTDQLGNLGPDAGAPDQGTGNRDEHSRFRNVFVNDPCSDPAPTAPFPTNFFGVVQSETEIAVLNHVANAERDNEDNGDDDNGPSGRLMVAGYNDSLGFYNNREGLSGFSYSTNGGKSWIDGGGLPPIGPKDQYFGDPVVVVHHRTKTFYYASIYQDSAGKFSLTVNRGHFRVAPPQGRESKANTRCGNNEDNEENPSPFGTPDSPEFIRERIIWEPPVEAVTPVGPPDKFGLPFLDKEWLYVDQKTGFLFLTYTRFGSLADGVPTPIEMVRSFDGGHTWTPPTVIQPNIDDTFNTATQPVVTPTGRVIVTWLAQTFDIVNPPFPVLNERIEAAFSDDGGNTFGAPVRVTYVNPQGEPKGYNRRRSEILNAPYIMVDKGKDDGLSAGDDNEDSEDRQNRKRPGYGNVYITYFDGKTPLPQASMAADIKLSVSTDNGNTYRPPVRVNDDNTNTSHVFPSVQVNKRGTVFVTWIDRRVDPVNNILNDTWGAFSNSEGRSFGRNFRITDISTDWFARADAAPNFGDYNSSEVINFDTFCSIWSDARFPPGTIVVRGRKRRAATPDVLFSVVGNGARNDDDGSDNRGGDSDHH